MGWTEYRASYFKSGKVDRKAECDAYFLEGHNRGHWLCREKKKEKKTRSLSALPVGTVIKWKIGETERVAYKHEAAYQFKRPFWMAMDNSRYYKKTQISNNWEIWEGK